MGPFLHAHRVQCHARGQPRGESLPDVHGQGLTGGETAAVRELGQRVVDAAALEPPGHFLGEQGVERSQAHHSARLRLEPPLHCDATLVAVAVIHGRLAELGSVLLVGPVGPPDPVRRGKLNDTRKIADRKSTRLNSSHANISYAVFCLKKKKKKTITKNTY